MGLRTRTELIPEAGELAIDDEGYWFCFADHRVLFVDDKQIAHVRWAGATIILEKDQPIGWSAPPIDRPRGELEIDLGWRVEQSSVTTTRQGVTIERVMFPTPLGEAFLYHLVQDE